MPRPCRLTCGAGQRLASLTQREPFRAQTVQTVAVDHEAFRRTAQPAEHLQHAVSFRDRFHQWDPKNQRPELWSLYNTRISLGESVRVFPLSNWTELDVWLYIYNEDIPIVPLYFAKWRPVVSRHGTLIMVDDNRMRLEPGEKPEARLVRFRTLGCYPLSGAIESMLCSTSFRKRAGRSRSPTRRPRRATLAS